MAEPSHPFHREPDAFFVEIREKLVNTFTLLMLASMGRQSEMSGELPIGHPRLTAGLLSFRLFLVIPKVPDQHLSPITDKFRKTQRVERKTWALHDSDLWVLNERTARLQGLIN